MNDILDELNAHSRADYTSTEARRVARFLPPSPPSDPGCRYVYGALLLTYLLTNVDCYGYLSDDDLELANYAAGYAVSARDISPRAVDIISAVRHDIARVLRTRAAERISLTLSAVNLPACASPAKPNMGPMAPLSPVGTRPTPPSAKEKVQVTF